MRYGSGRRRPGCPAPRALRRKRPVDSPSAGPPHQTAMAREPAKRRNVSRLSVEPDHCTVNETAGQTVLGRTVPASDVADRRAAAPGPVKLELEDRTAKPHFHILPGVAAAVLDGDIEPQCGKSGSEHAGVEALGDGDAVVAVLFVVPSCRRRGIPRREFREVSGCRWPTCVGSCPHPARHGELGQITRLPGLSARPWKTTPSGQCLALPKPHAAQPVAPMRRLQLRSLHRSVFRTRLPMPGSRASQDVPWRTPSPIHSRSFVTRESLRPVRIALCTACSSPTSTTSRFPRVTAV